MLNTATALDRYGHRTEHLTDTPIFHALAAAATPIYLAMTTAGTSTHRLPSQPEFGSPNHHAGPPCDPMDGWHALTLPIPIQPRAPRPSLPRAGAGSAASRLAGPTTGATAARLLPPSPDRGMPETEYPRGTGRHRLRSPGYSSPQQ